MDTPFAYDNYVTGKHFIGRDVELAMLSNLLTKHSHVVMYEPPRSGKKSLLQQTFHNMKVSGSQFRTVEFSLLTIRTTADLILGLGDRIFRCFATTPSEYEELVNKYLSDTHLVFDKEVFADRDRILSLNWDVDDNDVRAVFSLPFRIAADNSQSLFLVMDEFQNIMFTEDGDHLSRILEDVMKEFGNEFCSVVFLGSMVNAMTDIFRTHGRFFRLATRVELMEIDPKEIIDFAVRGFLTTGKVVDRDLMLGAAKLFRSNMWYVNHFCAIADSLSKGYIMEPILVEALEILISIHAPRFVSMVNDLTTFQLCLLKAILDGHTRFSSSEVIKKYNLNSSANVRRLKDALCKKEIVTFDSSDNPVLLDPLFDYWLRKNFFVA